MRNKIDIKTETEVFLLSRRRCCICYGLNRDTSQKSGQIAHLDQDSSNGKLENLAFLCLHHHDLYDTSTSQSKNLTITEVKSYRKELYTAIDTIWKQPVSFGEVIVDLNEKIVGHYISDGKVSSAEIDIRYLGNNKVIVQGFALWGKTREFGPNIGQLDFYAEINDNKIIYFDNTLNDDYQIQIKITEIGLEVTEQNYFRHYGMNVTFQGVYNKIEK